jgi:hypothetical protein
LTADEVWPLKDDMIHIYAASEEEKEPKVIIKKKKKN